MCLQAINSYSNDITRLDSIITYDGFHVNLHKENITSGANGITKADGFIWSNDRWDESYFIDYTYDTKGNLLSEIKTIKDSPDYIESKNTFSYDSKNNFLSEEFFLCDSSSQLVGVGKYKYTYNTNLLITEVSASTWDPKTSSWIETSLHKYAYDSNQNQILIETHKKSISYPKWEKDTKTERTYNTSNILTEESVYKGAPEGWHKISKTVYELNGDNTPNRTTNYKNDGKNQWINSNQYLYEYSKNKLLAINEYVWDGGSWLLHSKDDYSYTGNNLSSIKSSMKKSNNAWGVYMEKVFTNNGGTNSIEQYSIQPKGEKRGITKTTSFSDPDLKENEKFAWENGQWTPLEKNLVSFNNDSQVSSLEKYGYNYQEYYKSKFEYLPDGRIFTELVFDWYQNNWELGKRIQYFYADSVTSIDNTQLSPSIEINTGVGVINIESESPLKNVKVFTMTGLLIYNGTDSQINTSSWTKGAYIISVTTRSNEHKATKVLTQ